MVANNDTIDINQISIDNCFSCPYPDCVATDSELCSYLKEAARKERKKFNAEKERQDIEALKCIEQVLGNGSITLHQVASSTGFSYSYVQSLMRRGRLKVERYKQGNKTRVRVLGVKV